MSMALRSWTDHVMALRQMRYYSSVLQLYFYLENSSKIHPRGMSACRPKGAKRREQGVHQLAGRDRPLALWLPPFCLIFPPLGLPYVNWAGKCCLFYLRFSGPQTHLPYFYFRELFLPYLLAHSHSGLLFPILTPNIPP